MATTKTTPQTIIWKGKTIEVKQDLWLSDEVASAQTYTHYLIRGQRYARIPFGWESETMPLRYSDEVSLCKCCAYRTQLHLPGCDYEQCPVCLGHRSSCDCPWDDGIPAVENE
jgi:hypothetical protein